MDDEVGIAADRRSEVRVRRAREARVAEVARVVVRLLQRAQDERGKRLRPALGLAHVLGDALARLPRRGWAASEGVMRLAARSRRRRHLEVGQLGEHELDRLRLGRLVDAVERVALAARRGTRRRPRWRGSSAPRSARGPSAPTSSQARSHPALAVEREVDLAALDPERAAREAPPPQLGRDAVGQPERRRQLRLGSLAGEDRSAWPYVSRSLLRMTER